MNEIDREVGPVSYTHLILYGYNTKKTVLTVGTGSGNGVEILLEDIM